MRPHRFARRFAWLALVALPSMAATPGGGGFRFEHGDWAVSCDNTRTCRADGYQHEDGDPMPVSVLLTRAAGPGQPVKGELALGTYDEDSAATMGLPATFALAMTLDGKALGKVAIDRNSMEGTLSDAQVAALVASLGGRKEVIWSFGKKTWRLSGEGGAAVLLKMDEFQGRIGTRGALIRKGPAGEEHVLPALPPPVVNAAKPIDTDENDKRLSPADATSLRAALLATLKPDDCPEAREHPADNPVRVARLDARKQVASLACWQGAYQGSSDYWLVNRKAPWNPALVADSATDYADGEISSSLKGRGLGDCWASGSWTWDGTGFVHTASATTGMCKLIAAGGPWDLPTLVTEVKKSW